MNLETQIQSMVFSLFFGMFYSLLFNILYSCFFKTKKYIRFISTIIFVFFMNSIYFLILIKINSGILSYYFIFMAFIGFALANRKTKKIRCYFFKKLEIVEKT